MPNYGPSIDESYILNRPGTIQSGAGTNVSVLTALTGWVLVADFVNVLFALQNTDATNEVSLIVETSEDGSHADAEFWRATALAGEQVSYELGFKSIRQYYRMSAVTASPGFPTVAVNWQLTGLSPK